MNNSETISNNEGSLSSIAKEIDRQLFSTFILCIDNIIYVYYIKFAPYWHASIPLVLSYPGKIKVHDKCQTIMKNQKNAARYNRSSIEHMSSKNL